MPSIRKREMPQGPNKRLVRTRETPAPHDQRRARAAQPRR